jgi:hypothetical protein
VILVGGFARNTTMTAAAGTTERFDSAASGGASVESSDLTQAVAGATGAKTITPANTTAPWIGQTVALRDAATAGLSISSGVSPTFSASLNAGDATPTYDLDLSVSDSRTGSGAGWNLTITSTTFTTGSASLATTASDVTGATAACYGGGLCAGPTNAVAYPLDVPAGTVAPTAVKLYNAASSTGQGTFDVTPTVQVAVPQNSFSGSYTSLVTVSVVSGP